MCFMYTPYFCSSWSPMECWQKGLIFLNLFPALSLCFMVCNVVINPTAVIYMRLKGMPRLKTRWDFHRRLTYAIAADSYSFRKRTNWYASHPVTQILFPLVQSCIFMAQKRVVHEQSHCLTCGTSNCCIYSVRTPIPNSVHVHPLYQEGDTDETKIWL